MISMPFQLRGCRLFFFIAVSLLLSAWSLSAQALDAVTLQLKWTHAFQFAGYYAAQEKGFYRDVGLDVSFVEAHPGDSPVQAVIDGKAQYGVGSSSLILARKAGAPVIVLAAIFQHSPLVLITSEQTSSQGVHDLLDRRVMLESQDDELLAYLKQEGIQPDRIKRVEHSFTIQDLIDGKVDAISGYTTNQPYYLARVGFPYHIYTPRSAGIDFYGDNLFTTERELKLHPARVKAFREASLRGWNYAMEHPEEIVDLIVAKYPNRNTRDYYLFESRQLVPLLRSDLIEIGYMNPGRWRHIAETYADLGLLPHGFSLKGFLYQPKPERDLRWLFLALLLLSIVSGVAFYIYQNSRRLAAALDASNTSKELLRVSEQRFRDVAEVSAVWIWEIDAAGRYTYASGGVEAIIGYKPEEVLGKTIFDFMTEEEGLRVTPLFKNFVAGKMPVRDFQSTVLDKNGTAHDTLASATPLLGKDGELLGYRGVDRDITERLRLEAQIRQLAFHDALTGLPNRRLLSDRIMQVMAANKRSGCFGALLFLDLDNFKPLNDAFGHELGDLLLIEVAKRLKSCVRESDTVARFGGDEFVVVLSELAMDGGLSTLQAEAVAQKIGSSLSELYRLATMREGQGDVTVEHRCTVSIGAVMFVGDEDDPDDLLKRADRAMYAAKDSGRNAVCFAPESLHPGDVARSIAADFVPLEWRTEYESGNALIDAQHRALFEAINQLLTAILAARPADEVSSLIAVVIEKAIEHFKDEEAILQASGFPDVQGHAALHQDFHARADELVNRFHGGNLPLGELFRFLTQDIAQHITVSDRAYFSFL